MTKQTVMSVGREIDLTTAMEMFPEQIVAGNVDPTIIQEGRAEEVLAQSRECIEKAKYHKGGYRPDGRLRRAAARAAGERVPVGQSRPRVRTVLAMTESTD